jgi:hypothetical protein
MEDPAELLIRRALGRRPPPKPGPTLVDDVMRRVSVPARRAASGRAVPWRLGVLWLTAAGASLAVLAHVPWSGAARTAAWGLALALVPLAYSAALWPDRILGLLALCGGPPPTEPREAPPAVTPSPPSRSRAEPPR